MLPSMRYTHSSRLTKRGEKAVWAWKKANPDLDEEGDLPAELAEPQDQRAHELLLPLKIKLVA
jgi:hypothetical protein